ncbi:ABC transporter permease subunit [bacterium]|nr:ABC transporter permease subunit [bacterium]
MSRFSLNNVGFIWQKELLDIVRDRRTLMSMIVVPLLLIPVMVIGVGALMASSISDLKEQTYTVALLGADADTELAEVVQEAERTQFLDLDSDTAMAREMIDAGDIQGAVYITKDGVGKATVRMWVRKNRETSTFAMDRVEDQLVAHRKEVTRLHLAELGEPEDILTPFVIEEENLASDEQMAASGLASFLPYMLILMTLTGAIYPAIDMTAGEKERGTLETLLASPAGRLEIVLGKYFAVMTTSVTSALISVISMMVMLTWGMVWLGAQMGEQLTFQISFGNMMIAVLMMLPLAALFSSLLMTIAVFAKSTREAQSYIVPLNMLVILPAMMSMVPGSEGDLQRAWTPVVNVSLVLKDILNGSLDPAQLGITLLSTTIYAIIGIFITTKVFQRENVLFRV